MAKKKDILELCITDTNARQMTLRKYMPFFEMVKLNSTSKKYDNFDLSSLALAILHYLLVKGKLQERGIQFEELESFVKEYISKSYDIELDTDESIGLTDYILKKLNNDTGEAFVYKYYDPQRKEFVQEKIKYIKYTAKRINSDEYVYMLTPEGIDFFLQTKEFGEESKVTIYLLLLQQQLKNSDFEGVYNSVVKINAEVLQQIERKQEIYDGLLYAGQEGFNKYKEYCEEVDYRLKDEQDLFETTYKMVQEIKDEYIKKANVNFAEMKEEEQENIEYLYNTDKELEVTINRHSNLLNEVVTLKKDVLDIRKEKRRKAFKKSFNFEHFLNSAVKKDNVFLLRGILNPLLNPNLKKDFNPDRINGMYEFNTVNRIDDGIKESQVEISEEETFSFEEIASDRIYNNYSIYMKSILSLLTNKNEITLDDLIKFIEEKYSKEALINADFSAFIFSLNDNRELGATHASLKYSTIVERGDEARLCEKIYLELIDKYEEFSFLRYTSIDIVAIRGTYCEIGNDLMITNFKYKR